jgi:hypothetical protein
MSDHKCTRCGWKYPSFHVCMDMDNLPPLSKVMRELLYGPPKARRKLGPMTDAHKRAVSEGQRERWAKVRAKNEKLEQKVVERYKEGGVGINDLRDEFQMGKDRIMRILREAQARGEVTVRPRGHTLKTGAK